ncbi:hypothetical protein [Intestinirhabdus alba]|jgi:hypothetical protein|uniref:Uncharacterized protein n=1 Tax=Intestinirhabdus alba TaxID=2899544 RepID=A0A6L6IVU9_9ENTR|nr:hypothetical protein [Intestinirhabdus alba]MTH48863.1 hypothetical protein [Intestinirhabdus alba]
MRVDFNNLLVKDGALSFIDNGQAFSAVRNNKLDAFIKSKAGYFYHPKQKNGDLASINLVIFDCIIFYHSTELMLFLKELIQETGKVSDNINY